MGRVMVTRAKRWALSAALVLAAHPALADDDPALVAARAKVTEGADDFKLGHFEDALHAFTEAHHLLPKNGKIYFDIAKTQLQLARNDEAAESFEQFIQSAGRDPKVDPATVSEAKREIVKAQGIFAAVPVIPTGPGRRHPTGVRIRVDDATQSRLSTSNMIYLPVKPKEHTLTVVADGMQSAPVMILTASPGLQPAHEIELAPVITASPPADADGSKEIDPTPADPCDVLRQACEQAGYKAGHAYEGRGLVENCMRPLIKGETLMGVEVPLAIVASCRHPGAKAGRMHKH